MAEGSSVQNANSLQRSVHFTSEGTLLPEEAEQILGTDNVLGYKEVKEVFGIDRNDPIPFTRAELERAKFLGQQLVLYSDMVRTPNHLGSEWDHPTTLDNLKKTFTKSHDGHKLFHEQDWYHAEDFFKKERVRPGWRLAAPDILPNTLSKDYVEQTEVLVDYLQKEIFKGTVPPPFDAAMGEFDRLKPSLVELVESNWLEASRRLSELAITKLTRESPVEVMYRLILNDFARGKKLLSSYYTWTSGRAANGDIIYIGGFGGIGAGDEHGKPGDPDLLGVCLARVASDSES